MMLAHDFLSLIFDYVDEGANVKVSCNGVGRHLSCSRLNFFPSKSWLRHIGNPEN